MNTLKAAAKTAEYLEEARHKEIYEYHCIFDDFIPILGKIFINASDLTGTYRHFQMMNCIYTFRSNNKKMDDLCKKIEAENDEFDNESRTLLYSMIPEDIWRFYYSETEDYLNEINEPFTNMETDAIKDFLRRFTFKDINSKYCLDCKHRIRCALKPEEEN